MQAAIRLFVTVVLAMGPAADASSQSPALAPVGVLQSEGGLAPRVLAEQAQRPPDVPLQPVPVTELELRTSDPDLDGPRISLAFGEPTAIRDVLLLVARGTRLSVVPDPGPALEQTFLGELRNLTIREALDAVVESLELDYTVRGSLLRVFPRALDTRLYDVDYVIAREARPGLDGPQPPDFYADLAGGVQALLSAEGRMHFDRTAALLQVTDRQSRLDRVEQYLEVALLRATRQILIEATVLEVEFQDASSAGVDWQAVVDRLALPGAPATGSRGEGRARVLPLRGDRRGVLEALADQGAVHVLATPRLRAMNNQPALVRSQSEGGFSLAVTPQISSEGIVHMAVHPLVTERAGRDRSPAGAPLPAPAVREVDTLVRVGQGETLAISGFIQDHPEVEVTRIPVLGSVPLLGGLFRREQTIRRRTELVILLTPILISPGAALAAQTR